jgi:hypothetical protein
LQDAETRSERLLHSISSIRVRARRKSIQNGKSRTEGIHEFDTEGMRSKFKAQTPLPILKGDGKPVWIHRFRGGAVQVCVFSREMGDANKTTREWVEVQIPASLKSRTLLAEEEIKSAGGLSFFPSPNGKKVAILVTSSKDEEMIIIVNDSGAIEARIVP